MNLKKRPPIAAQFDAHFERMVNAPRQIILSFDYRNSALAMALEFKGRLHQPSDRSSIRSDLRIARIGLAVPLRQGGFGVKGIDLAGAAVHE